MLEIPGFEHVPVELTYRRNRRLGQDAAPGEAGAQ